MTQVILKPGTEIVSLKTKYGYDIPHDDPGSLDDLWIYRDTMGIVCLTSGRSFEDAYYNMLDELHPIDEDDIYEAYGFYGDTAKDDYNKAIELAETTTAGYPQLEEGYHYQGNASGTGIVQTDLNGESLDLLTTDLIKRLGINIQIRTY